MKRQAIGTLVKDIIILAVAGGIGALIFFSEPRIMSTEFLSMLMCALVAGIPFGWRWASKLITAVSIQGVGIKLLISVFLGWLAIFVIFIGDIIRCFTARAETV